MGFFSFCYVKFLVLVLFLDIVTSTEPTRSSVRRGLQNFIRVGKRYGEEELWEIPTEEKRMGKLGAFPRIGRSSSTWSGDESTEKRSDSNTGMWFGPRIGRSSADIEAESPWMYILLNSDKPLRREIHETNSRNGGERDLLNENIIEELTE